MNKHNDIKEKKKRSKSIIVRFNDDEYHRIKQIAKENGLETAVYIRKAAFEFTEFKDKHKKNVINMSVSLCKRAYNADILEDIKNIEIFRSLSDEELLDILDKMLIKSFEKGDTILSQEESNEFIYIVLKGQVKIFIITEYGKEVILAIHKEGSSFGELSVFDGDTTSATIVAREKSIIALLGKDEFKSIIDSYKTVNANFLKMLCSIIRNATDKIEVLSQGNAAQRIKLLFTLLLKKHGKELDNCVNVQLRLTHQEIADMSALTRETVTKTLNKWLNDGEITIFNDHTICFHPEFLKDDLIL
ncbi:MAG: Crp/Fnr family transcriptional regulator [Nitrospirae bacterium]|nr:Crp/Fnr family transcriptional regulator [Nitrospirota bacterium]